jgi:ketosteroid isomerase-like protein
MRTARLVPIGLAGVWLAAAVGAKAAVLTACVAPHPGLSGLLETEYAFAERARSSVRAAFLEYLAEDSWVLQPGPVPGRALYTAAKDNRNTLEWYPAFADLAASDDLGFTTGPWVYTVAASGEQLHGHYLSVWKRDAHCLWRVEFDGGIAHELAAQVEGKLLPVAMAAIKQSAAPATRLTVDAVGRAINDFQLAAQQNGLAAGLRTFARNGDFWLYTEGSPPMAIGAAEPYLDKHSMTGSWRETARDGSADSTLVYTLGELTDANHRISHAYVQIWQYDPRVANWGLRVLLVSPLPPSKRKS